MKHPRRTRLRLAGAAGFALCATCSLMAGERPLAGRDVLLFDPGPGGSELAARAIGLRVGSGYSPATGYGWTQRPQKSLRRDALGRSRTALTIDGVAGDRLGFRIDVDPGVWLLTIWLETGESGSRWPKVLVQGQPQALPWQEFRPQDEPNRSLQKMYRVFGCATTAGSDGVSVELDGDQGPVELLGISVIRRTSCARPDHRRLLQQIEAAGSYQQSKPLDDVLQLAEASLRKDPDDPFFAIWRLRLELLTMAEHYYEMRGWQWADMETGLGMFDRQYQAVMLLDGFLAPAAVEAGPLAERAVYCRGRLLHWLGKQRGGDEVVAAAMRDLQSLAERHPDDRLLAMYNGQRVDIPDTCDCLSPVEDVPAWSALQREALCRLRGLVHWWVEHRQSATGELGGKFGDDVEMLRWWAPLCLAGDEIALKGWRRLADGVWQSKHIANGYAQKLADVEHAAEFVADTASLMVVYSDEPRYEERLAPSAQHFESLWTGTTTAGNRFFRSAWFSATELAAEEPRGRDVEYNTRAVQAMRYLAWRYRDPRLVELLHEWSMAWVDASMRTDKGKPKGIIPASVRFADEAVNGDGPNWHRAGMYWDYFDWQHYCGSLILDQLLFTYSLTKDERLLQPMFLSLDLIRSEGFGSERGGRASPPEGSPAWAAAHLIACQQFWNVVEQWRVMFGDRRWDDLIMRYGTAFGRHRISGEESHLTSGLNSLLEELRYNTALRTSEALYTDRVRVPGAELVKGMLTGDGVKDNLSPYYAVSWQQTGDDFTALVTSAGRERLNVELFHHGEEDRDVLMRVWQLAPGDYQMRCEAAGAIRQTAVVVRQPGQRIAVRLPSRRLVRLALQPSP